ncbi:hypothetical protein ILUMI_22023 [Ignelater luminosus]|uniref:Secreted protein n=1 Tax=Ignelater luminosus TaxID=2038154 RepID=A0A8K0CDG7_IGNLU|nr:hypothetical protein ILUMI_22023 [Ignelater luminosus]
MKTLLISVLLLTVFFGNISAKTFENGLELENVEYQQRAFEGIINDTINKLAETLGQYDPIQIEHWAFDILGHSCLIENWKMEGFSKIVAARISFSGFINWTLDMEINIGPIEEFVKYWKVVGELLYGEGKVNFDMDKANLKIVVTLNPITMNVKSATITPHISNAKHTITGLLHDEELSRKVSDYMDWLLNDYISNNKQLHDWLNNIFYNLLKRVIG